MVKEVDHLLTLDRHQLEYYDTCIRALEIGGLCAGVLTHLTLVKLIQIVKAKKGHFGIKRGSRSEQNMNLPIVTMMDKLCI
jgi:hypothetical protein